jgi:DNA (cytosine-5)-methyltransferase 1
VVGKHYVRFVDLFAGLGGFHLALRNLGHECVFASEVDESLRTLYEKNFQMPVSGDLRRVEVRDIPHHDILCAGFPCQPFSKAGRQTGLAHPELGDLYLQIFRVIRAYRPKYVILENVPNLSYHDNGESWNKISTLLDAEGYYVDVEKLSPHQYGIPQIRERIYIVASLKELATFKELIGCRAPLREKLSLDSVLSKNPPNARPIPDRVKKVIKVWQQFLDLMPKGERVPHPLWSMEFGATYPYERTTPSAMQTKNLRNYRGAFGQPLSDAKLRSEIFSLLPSHARTEQKQFPDWKVKFIRKNREFYDDHRNLLEPWIESVRGFPSSFQKLEWNCHEPNPLDEVRRLDRYVIQIRPSGVRVKRRTTAPSLVAMTATQVPIIPWEERYMTTEECKRLQSMEALRFLPDSPTKAYEALGNAVNVKVAELVAEALVGRAAINNGEEKSIRHETALSTIQIEQSSQRRG